eukprot:TRINITY_DN3663_c0_g4_i1.p1 TRINITY_DN3663_c0_g4~~TRINITY_DN3663_c0_g4_i1.p1  ORF type:complete len:297 (+),score=69.51 TRINITY_DN3663_c0_g4_i1:38-928(+)
MALSEIALARLQHFLKPYYVAHYMGFALYAYLRWMLENGEIERTEEEMLWYTELTGGDMPGVSREVQIWICWGMIVMSRAMRFKDIGELVGSAFQFGKACVVVSLFIIDWYLPIYFVVLWFVIFCVTSEPSFETPRKKLIKMDKKRMFDIVFTPHEEDTDQAQVYWFINVWASWQKSGASKQFNPVFAELSARYSNDFCKFTKVDAGRINNQTVIKKLGIDDSALSKHMPSLVCFKNGKEVQRLPLMKKEVSRLHEYSIEQIEHHFGFNKIFEETKKKTDKRKAARRKEAESKKMK